MQYLRTLISHNLDKFKFIVFSLFSSSIYFIFILILNLKDGNELITDKLLGFHNKLIIWTGILNLSTGQILQKNNGDIRVLKKLTKLLSLVCVTICLVVIMFKYDFELTLIILSSALITIGELHATLFLFNKKPYHSICIGMIPRLVVVTTLLFSFLIKWSFIPFLVATSLLMLTILINFYSFRNIKIHTDKIDFSISEIVYFNISNLSNSYLQNFLRIFLFKALSTESKFLFEYAVKFINLLLMAFDYFIRFKIQKLTRIIKYKEGNWPLRYFISKIQYLIYIIIIFLFFFNISNQIDIIINIIFIHMIIMQIWNFQNYVNLIRENFIIQGGINIILVLLSFSFYMLSNSNSISLGIVWFSIFILLISELKFNSFERLKLKNRFRM